MFSKSLKTACIFPLILFALTAFDMSLTLLQILSKDFAGYAFIPYNRGFFFDGFRENGTLMNLFVIFAAFVTAFLLFGFNWSKKQTNVIYSLGMSRSEIYMSRLIAGVLPMFGIITLITFLETCLNKLYDMPLDARYWKMALLTAFTWYAVYALAFVLCSVVFCNTGNPVEGAVFSLVLSVFPTAVDFFLKSTGGIYTLGAYKLNFTDKWNWSVPLFFNQTAYNLIGSSNYDNYDLRYFTSDSDTKITFYNFTPAITAIILCVIIGILGYFAFRKHKNEIAGTFGRAKGMTEIAAAVSGFYAFTLLLLLFEGGMITGNGKWYTFVFTMLAFFIAMLVFKLVFSAKRKKSAKQTCKRIPIYAAGLGAVTLVFALGLFGYSSYIPDASEIAEIRVSSSMIPYLNNCMADSAFYGLKDMNVVRLNMDFSDDQCLKITEAADKESAIRLHQMILDDGKIKDSAENACSCPILFEYRLKNGKTVTREYYESTNESFYRLLSIGNLNTAKKYLDSMFSIAVNGHNGDTAYMEKMLEAEIKKDIRIDDNFEVWDENSNSFGFINIVPADQLKGFGIDPSSAEGMGDTVMIFSPNYSNPYFDDGDERAVVFGSYNDEYLDYQMSGICYTNIDTCYLLSKDMSKAYSLGIADTELIEALRKDIYNQTAEQYFIHSPEDEVGIISFGIGGIYRIGFLNGYGMEVEYFDDSVVDESGPEAGTMSDLYAWNINDYNNFVIIVTKGMTNTLEYFQQHGLMKYFEPVRNVDDVKSIKTATLGELYGRSRMSSNYPVFCAGYESKTAVDDMKVNYSDLSEIALHTFIKINKPVTDKTKIEKVLESSVLFGFCPNNSRVVEIEYNDGSFATVMISEKAYKEIF